MEFVIGHIPEAKECHSLSRQVTSIRGSDNKHYIKKTHGSYSDIPGFSLMEIGILFSLRHPNLMHAIGMRLNNHGTIDIYMPYGGPTLRIKPEDNRAMDLYQQAGSVLFFLHSCGISHMDLKGYNMTLGGEGVLKLIDFDHSVFTKAYNGDHTMFYTDYYRPPEYTGRELEVEDRSIDRMRSDFWAMAMSFLISMVPGAIAKFYNIEDLPPQNKGVMRDYLLQMAACRLGAEHPLLSCLSRLCYLDPSKRVMYLDSRCADAMARSWRFVAPLPETFPQLPYDHHGAIPLIAADLAERSGCDIHVCLCIAAKLMGDIEAWGMLQSQRHVNWDAEYRVIAGVEGKLFNFAIPFHSEEQCRAIAAGAKSSAGAAVVTSVSESQQSPTPGGQ